MAAYFGILIFLFLSLWIWMRKRIFLQLAALAMALFPLLFFFGDALSPVPGVVTTPSLLRTEPDKTASFVDEIPLKRGERVRIAGVTPDGKWIRVYSGDGRFGFVEARTASALLQ